jgi:hypothetical protein
MNFLTQTSLDPGNCFQTVIAMLLGLPPEALPDQTQCDAVLPPRKCECGAPNCIGVVRDRVQGTPWYSDWLGVYLKKHHGLAYYRIDAPWESARGTIDIHGYHALSGHTVRSATAGTSHIVLAKGGSMVWDPHPSRAGLIEDGEVRASMLIPYPRMWASSSPERPCMCPACIAERAQATEAKQ